MGIVERAAQIRTGRTTVTEVVEDCLDAIARLDDDLNAFITVSVDEARAAARHADAEIAAGRDLGPLHGIPVSVKDIMDLRGLPTTAASRVLAGVRATADAPALARLRQAGAVFVGKCNLHEFAFGTTGEVSAFGSTRHPHVPGHMAGGSSSGSAVSVAAGMALASIGTDTGGSIRIPAAACGVVGLKPTFAELSCEGVVRLARTLDHVGPIGLTVADVGLIYQAMRESGPQPRSASRSVDRGGSVRLGLPRRYFLDLVDPAVHASFGRAVERLQAAGCLIDEVDIPHADESAATYFHTVVKEGYEAHGRLLDTRRADYAPSVRERLELGRSVSDQEYRDAQHTRTVLRREVDAALDGRDALVLPTLPTPAPPSGAEQVTLGEVTVDVRTAALRLTQLFDLTGHPALTIPSEPTADGLPCGVQLVGAYGHTLELVELGTVQEARIRG